jgi:hypothetical protein
MLTLGFKKVDAFVRKQQEAGNDVWFDGWDILFFRPADAAVYSKDGAFRNGVWGYINRVSVSDKGTWDIDYRNVKRVKYTRN